MSARPPGAVTRPEDDGPIAVTIVADLTTAARYGEAVRASGAGRVTDVIDPSPDGLRAAIGEETDQRADAWIVAAEPLTDDDLSMLASLDRPTLVDLGAAPTMSDAAGRIAATAVSTITPTAFHRFGSAAMTVESLLADVGRVVFVRLVAHRRPRAVPGTDGSAMLALLDLATSWIDDAPHVVHATENVAEGSGYGCVTVGYASGATATCEVVTVPSGPHRTAIEVLVQGTAAMVSVPAAPGTGVPPDDPDAPLDRQVEAWIRSIRSPAPPRPGAGAELARAVDRSLSTGEAVAVVENGSVEAR